ncbi:MAG: UDP-2,3-diacylglucosamine diphosphatase LpxI, partial [Pseudomonadota bacterium]|nr:UDP-2,3-diacylglucosamine diphosphatase LpxI [Pseudomonadota bacterium]
VLGIEAIEGTDQLMARCGALRRPGPGPVLVKFCKIGQTRVADLPTIGPATIARAAAAGFAGIAVEAGGCLLVDRHGLVAAADRKRLFLWGVTRDSVDA